jgi:hypothetical protein
MLARPHVTWNPSFFRKSPLFWPIARAASALEGRPEWPAPDDLTALFEGEPRVRFEPAPPQPRRGRTPADARYDARIALASRVPTRARSWHDLLNALVWVTFPRAKAALHARQHRMIAARLGDDLRLPGARTKEQDLVAMLDEGGVVVLCAPARRAAIDAAIADGRDGDVARMVAERAAFAVIFGHAIYASLACGGPPSVRAAAYVVDAAPLASARDALVASDAALTALLAREAPLVRGELTSLVIDGRLAAATEAAIDAPEAPV